MSLTTQTQKERVLDKLLAVGYISNFWAIENRILRLGAVIAELKEDGYSFRGEYLENSKNYCYHLLRSGKDMIKIQ